MTMRRGGWMFEWSVQAYRLLLHVYPTAFRRECGEAMVQAFRDLARDGWRASGARGLAVVWLRTAIDLMKSVPAAYLGTSSGTVGRLALGVGALYMLYVFAFVGYGASQFSQFYEAPAWNARPTAENFAPEDDRLSAYEQAMNGAYGRYPAFLESWGIVVAPWLGVAAALFGLWQRSLWHGLAALVVVAVATSAIFHLLPWRYFPLDQYPVGFLWLFQFPIAAASWFAVTAVGRLIPWHGGVAPPSYAPRSG